MAGTLFLCATPIGNLEDMTFRCVRTLQEADLIAVEDTRNSIRLLNHFDIHTEMTSYHEHNMHEKGPKLIEKLIEGKNIALVTDAGMPGISDPGEQLVRLAAEAGIEVTVIPGACACVSALVVSGLSTEGFAFEGFLPVDSNTARKERLERLQAEERTIVLYEAPHRLMKTLAVLLEALGDRRVSVCRELTKKHENILRTKLSEALKYYNENEPRGECVIVLEGKSRKERQEEERADWNKISIQEHFDKYTSEGIDRKEAMKAVAKDRGISKREVYERLLEK